MARAGRLLPGWRNAGEAARGVPKCGRLAPVLAPVLDWNGHQNRAKFPRNIFGALPHGRLDRVPDRHAEIFGLLIVHRFVHTSSPFDGA